MRNDGGGSLSRVGDPEGQRPVGAATSLINLLCVAESWKELSSGEYASKTGVKGRTDDVTLTISVKPRRHGPLQAKSRPSSSEPCAAAWGWR